MQQPYSELQLALAPLVRQLERQEERLRDVATRSDLAELRKELVRQDTLRPQLDDFQRQIARLEADRIIDKGLLEKEIADMRSAQISRQDRFWLRMGQAIAVLAFILAFFEFVTHLKLAP